MLYSKRIIVLGSITIVLTLLYVATFLFSVDSRARRSAAWTPLDKKAAAAALSIEITSSETVLLEKNNGIWSIRFEDNVYPVRQTRVEDLFTALTKRAEYPARSSSADSWDKFGVGTDAQKILIKKDGGAALAELYFGSMDATGRDIFIRSGNVVRSGEDKFSLYLGERKNWYDLNLFPNHQDQGTTVENIQRLVVTPPPSLEEARADLAPYTLVRDENGWKFEDGGAANKTQVESAIRYILDAIAENFLSPAQSAEAAIETPSGSILLEKGDLSRLTISAGKRVNDKPTVKVSGIDQIFLLSNYTEERLWRAKDEFTETP